MGAKQDCHGKSDAQSEQRSKDSCRFPPESYDRRGSRLRERTIAAMNQFPEQETLIRGEAAKSRRHKPLRHIFAQATDVLTAVCPCWMASPLSVCQLIAATGTFDYVIFDEASQVLPEDAVPAILRGKHVIVAGDNKQLPPSAFFAAADEDDEADGDATAWFFTRRSVTQCTSRVQDRHAASAARMNTDC